MKNFQSFLTTLLANPQHVTVSIQGKKKTIKGMARFTTINYPRDEYIKVTFHDHSFLLILPKEQELYYADKVIEKAPGITDNMIGNVETLEYNGKIYKLGNKNDYQYVLQHYLGSINDIESECRFSDYFPTEGPKEFLSLGWLSYTGKRADVHVRILYHKDIDITST